MRKKIFKKKGLTMLEMVITISVLTIGLTGTFALVSGIISRTTTSSFRLIAAYLGQEGIEIVRNIRDTNWLEGFNWDEGLAGEGEADYDDYSLGSFQDRFLNLDGNGFYSYNPGTQTKFKRKITIKDREDLYPSGDPDGVIDKMTVLVEVFWKEKGKKHSLAAQEDLYKWY